MISMDVRLWHAISMPILRSEGLCWLHAALLLSNVLFDEMALVRVCASTYICSASQSVTAACLHLSSFDCHYCALTVRFSTGRQSIFTLEMLEQVARPDLVLTAPDVCGTYGLVDRQIGVARITQKNSLWIL
jgi:hypothetical protein